LTNDNYSHIPVLLDEAISLLNPQPNQNFVDATLGGGGYTRALLEKIGPNGKVLAIDLDQTAIDLATSYQLKTKSLIPVHGNFADIDQIVTNHKFNNISGIVADIGLSSYQLDASGRGISFQKKEPLDMRFDLSKDTSDAKFILNNHDEQDLTKIFEEYGEEKYAKAIARKIVSSRNEKPFHYTTDLVEAITEALPKPVKHLYADSCRRIFQALRIAVNHELENLERFLPKALDILAPGGRLVIVSFHSLEDRIVKQFFLKASRGCVCPIDFPECICGKSPLAKVLTKKIVTATEAELETNMRSKPAKLRAIQKI
jgi:16S rRNA (cytosine1402-N4)-methyltransferase